MRSLLVISMTASPRFRCGVGAGERRIGNIRTDSYGTMLSVRSCTCPFFHSFIQAFSQFDCMLGIGLRINDHACATLSGFRHISRRRPSMHQLRAWAPRLYAGIHVVDRGSSQWAWTGVVILRVLYYIISYDIISYHIIT